VLVGELLSVLERLAPFALAQPGDDCGLLVGDQRASVRRILVALELTEPVFGEAHADGYDTILTHHPLLYTPVRSLRESQPRERLLRGLVRADLNLIACHTNLDAADGGLADIAGRALGLLEMEPLEPARADWYKLVGFIPAEAVEAVAAAVFAAGAGVIGHYEDCAFACEGKGWFTPGPGADPAVGMVARPERSPEVRWETVMPRGRLGAAIRAFVAGHPYEEPAFDVYPIEDILPRVGLGRLGMLPDAVSVADLAKRVARVFEAKGVSWSGDGSRMVQRAGVLPGSGRGLLDGASGRCEVLITGDVGYHDGDRARNDGLTLISVPHGDFEWWAFKRWARTLASELDSVGVDVVFSQEWSSPWHHVSTGCGEDDASAATASSVPGVDVGGQAVRVWIDGGSRGNPGPSAIGVVIEDTEGKTLETIGRCIGVTTNNVAEYRALLAGLETAAVMGAGEVEVASDSELLVRQMLGQYKVKNEGLKPLHAEAQAWAGRFSRFRIRHIPREQNARADALVNRALDEQEGAGL
jgi:dinuclear metal center YbgI/SA1388 family protein